MFSLIVSRGRSFRPPAQVPADEFEIVSNRLPSSWRIRISGSRLVLAPSAWLQEGFWEAIFDETDQTVWARDVYDRELAVILAEDRAARDAGE